MKIKENQVSNISIYFERYPLHHILPAKLHYILIVYVKLSGQSADKSHMTGHLTSGRNNNTVDVLVLKGKLSFSFFFQHLTIG